MKLIKKMVFDLISPVALNATTTSSAAFDRPDALVTNILRDIKRLLNRVVNIPFVVAKPIESAEPSIVEQLRLMSLVKASTAIAETKPDCLKGKCVLCVGGQLQMYPAYRQIVEDAGGQFLSFHGVADAAMPHLHTLLNNADLIICPIDCVRHDAFFVTKDYCERSGKPYVMLDKSRITTFYNGIRMLKKYVVERTVFPIRSV